MKKFYLSAILLTCLCANAQILDVSVYDDCSKNGYTTATSSAHSITGTAGVSGSTGRTSCSYVQLWAGGPKWATFNVGATITDYSNLTIGADANSFYNLTDQAPYYNTANVGGLYPWNYYFNGRRSLWYSSTSFNTSIGDVATYLWGSNWKTPTYTQLNALRDSSYTTWTWCDGSTTQYVVGCTLKGYKVSGVGNYANYSIFLPAAGYASDWGGGMYVFSASDRGNYWSSLGYDIDKGYDSSSNIAYGLWIASGGHTILQSDRKYGYSIRAVLAK